MKCDLDKKVTLKEVDYYFSELWGIFARVRKSDVDNKKLLLKAKRMKGEDSESFSEFVVSHYWNRCICELSQKSADNSNSNDK